MSHIYFIGMSAADNKECQNIFANFPELRNCDEIEDYKNMMLRVLRRHVDWIRPNLKVGQMTGQEFREKLNDSLGTNFESANVILFCMRVYAYIRTRESNFDDLKISFDNIGE